MNGHLFGAKEHTECQYLTPLKVTDFWTWTCPPDTIQTAKQRRGDTPIRKGKDIMKIRLWIVGFGLFAALAAQASAMTINSFDRNGRLTFTAAPAATSYRVEWTTNLLAATWSSNAPGIPLIPAPGTGSLTVTVGVVHASCYYRVVATVTNEPPTVIASSFDLDSQDWTIVIYPFRSHAQNPATSALSHDGAFGNPPGSVRVGDIYSETGISAPAQYLGAKLGYYGGSFSYDIYLRYSDNVPYPAVVLNGGSLSLYYDAPSPPLNAWQGRTVPLSEAGWKVAGTGDAVTEAVFKTVLSNLVGLYIYTEWNTGDDDTSVDNVQMTPP